MSTAVQMLEVGTTWFFSSCGGILELPRGSQPSPWVGPGKPNLPLGLRGKALRTMHGGGSAPSCCAFMGILWWLRW